jgi:hypothetical protein
MLQAVTGYLLQLPGTCCNSRGHGRRRCWRIARHGCGPLDPDARRRVLGPDHPAATNSLGEVRRDLDLLWS